MHELEKNNFALEQPIRWAYNRYDGSIAFKEEKTEEKEKEREGKKTKVRVCVLILQASKMRVSNAFLYKRTVEELHIILS